MKQEQKILKNENDDLAGVADDIGIVSPGGMLKAARELRGLSQQQVAEKLNFRTHLVQNIEVDIFDRNLPEAFNRGYLKNYAKLVNLSEAVVLNSYDQLAEAQGQCAGMQSFSKGTKKQAEHNMLMWITYLILAILFTATVVWWFQTPSEQPTPIAPDPLALSATKNKVTEQTRLTNENEATDFNRAQTADTVDKLVNALNDKATELEENTENIDAIARLAESNLSAKNGLNTAEINLTNDDSVDEGDLSASIANVVFTFSGDCWVNIYDATGERIAWGVKKSGYIMRISGQAPFSITLGKPELVQIDYNDVSVDMTAFNAGNIAKFSLPIAP